MFRKIQNQKGQQAVSFLGMLAVLTVAFMGINQAMGQRVAAQYYGVGDAQNAVVSAITVGGAAITVGADRKPDYMNADFKKVIGSSTNTEALTLTAVTTDSTSTTNKGKGFEDK